MQAYGLGVQKYERRFSRGEEAIGHGGGNIGSVAYMVYLPERRISIVVMVNAFPTRSADFITRGLIRAVLRGEGASVGSVGRRTIESRLTAPAYPPRRPPSAAGRRRV